MNTVYFCPVERRNFGDLLSLEGVSHLSLRSARDLESLFPQPSLEDSLLAVWTLDPKSGAELPDLLVCRDGTASDWAAWITTFSAKIRPFSAFTRLIERSVVENLARAARTPALDRLTWAVSGLVLGEVLAASGLPDKSLETMAANACESTLSFAMFRAAAAYSNFQWWAQLVEAWEFVRQATRQHSRLVESSAVARVCATIIQAANLGDANALLGPGDRSVVHACREIIASPESAPSTLSALPEFAAISERMYGPREDRVVAFSDLIRGLDRPSSVDGELTSLLLGYVASRIAPGTIQHSAVLGPIVRRYPAALLWYGFCAGLGGLESNPKNTVGARRSTLDLPASARRVARDLLRLDPILAPPNCDIAFFELLALSRTGADPLAGLIRTTQGTATIELAPAVYTVVNVSSKLGLEVQSRTAKERDLIAAMGGHIDRLRELHSDLVKSDSGEAGQRTLFPPKRRKR